MNPLQRHVTLLKLLGILLLVGLLQIPLSLVNNLLRERAERRDTALAEITESWGRAQQITGPFLVIPYRSVSTATRDALVNGRLIQTIKDRPSEKLAVFLPETLVIDGRLDPERRHRGIYEAIVYSSRLKLSGRFSTPDLAALGIPASELLWDRAYLALGVDDLRGAREALAVSWNGQARPFSPGSRHPLLAAGVNAPLPPLSPGAAPGEFSLELTLNGSGRLAFTPVGRQTDVALHSSWADPSFTGALLPAERKLGAEGFDAAWRVSYYGREYPQQWADDATAPSRETLARSAFGVELVDLVDTYRIVERASKYGLLFVALLFTAFFLFEVLAALRLHVIHYTLVGAALILFYLGLLSLSEFISFAAAYVSAALASTLLIGLYSLSILRSGTRSLAITGSLAGIYGFLFFVLQMQDYALLAGTAALFAVLGLVMFVTRKLDWHHSAPDGFPASPGTEPPPLPAE